MGKLKIVHALLCLLTENIFIVQQPVLVVIEFDVAQLEALLQIISEYHPTSSANLFG
jgi:hypothetical protein